MIFIYSTNSQRQSLLDFRVRLNEAVMSRVTQLLRLPLLSKILASFFLLHDSMDALHVGKVSPSPRRRHLHRQSRSRWFMRLSSLSLLRGAVFHGPFATLSTVKCQEEALISLYLSDIMHSPSPSAFDGASSVEHEQQISAAAVFSLSNKNAALLERCRRWWWRWAWFSGRQRLSIAHSRLSLIYCAAAADFSLSPTKRSALLLSSSYERCRHRMFQGVVAVGSGRFVTSINR